MKHGPIQQETRIEVVDILRGLALLGILLANMAPFGTPMIYLQLTDIELWHNPWDRMVEGVLTIFVEGKFYTLFSFLFGWGYILFMDRANEKVARPGLLFCRRLAVLFCFGLIHAFFIWYGDILLLYSVAGFILLLFYSRQPKTLLLWAVMFVFLSILPMLLIVFSTFQMEEASIAQWVSANQLFLAEMEERIATSFQAYGAGTFADIMQQRIEDVRFMLSYALFTIPMLLPMFLLGAYVGKQKLFQRIEDFLPLIKKIWLISLVVGLGLNILKFLSLRQLDVHFPGVADLFVQVGMSIGDPALSIFYITTILLLVQKDKWRSRFAFLAPVGQMSLSHYIGQSIVCTTLFYSYGLGLYGQLGPVASTILAILIFAVQVWISRRWLARYRFGPLELIWRRLTYGQLGKNLFL